MILSILLSADAVRGQRPRPGRRPPFHARGFHPVYNARVSSKKFTETVMHEGRAFPSINSTKAGLSHRQSLPSDLPRSPGTISPCQDTPVEFRSILRQPLIAVEEFGNAAHHFFRCNAGSSGGQCTQTNVG